MDNKSVGKTISNLRKSQGLTQSQLAEKISVSDKAISKWETGEGMPEISNLIELSSVFNVNIDYIVKGEGAALVVKTNKPLREVSKQRIDEILKLIDEDILKKEIQETEEKTVAVTETIYYNEAKSKTSAFAVLTLILGALSIILSLFNMAGTAIALAFVAIVLFFTRNSSGQVYTKNELIMFKIGFILALIRIAFQAVILVISLITLLI